MGRHIPVYQRSLAGTKCAARDSLVIDFVSAQWCRIGRQDALRTLD